MLVHVEEDCSDASSVAAINTLHAPTAGTVVVHAPYGCPRREFAIEVLNALGRPPKDDEPTRQLVAWATSWLITAAPRCDLVIYGAARLASDSIRWLTELAKHDHVTVWFVSSPDEQHRIGTTDAPTWRWHTFITRPWPAEHALENGTNTLCGEPIPHGWPQGDLPPFPWTRRRIEEMPTRSPEYAAVLQLTLTYESVFAVIERVLGIPKLEARGVQAAVAYLSLISATAPDLSVLLRHLEEDVFLRGGLLVVDPQQVAERVATLRADHHFSAAHRTGTEHDNDPDPGRGVSILVSHLRQAERKEFTTSQMASAAIDGSTLVSGSGSILHVPSWWRWTIRAAAAMEADSPRHSQRPASPGFTAMSRLAGYSAITFREPVDPEDLHVALAPIIDAIAPVARFRRLADHETEDPTTAAAPSLDAAGPPLTLAAAQRLHDLYERQSGQVNRRDGLVDDAGLAWLVEHRLADRNERGIPGMAPWLFDVMQDRLGVRPDPEARLRRRFV